MPAGWSPMAAGMPDHGLFSRRRRTIGRTTMNKCLLTLAAVFGCLAGTADATEAGREAVRLLFNGEELVVVMEDNDASRALLASLPLTLTFRDYNGTEKIADLPAALDTGDAPSGCDPEPGSFTYYAPWGNLAIFYRDFRHSDGLVPLGRIEAGVERLARMRGDFSVRLERLNRQNP